MLPQNLIETIREDLTKHEGFKEEIYLDTEHLPTFGIGHLVLESDPEYTWPVGTPVEHDRIMDCFNADFNTAYEDCCALFLNFDSLPEQVQRVLVNMAFNLGRNRLGRFKKMITAVNEGNFSKAANEMVDSRWYNQVGNRSIELENWMRNA
mgnify:CR=1 FL=1